MTAQRETRQFNATDRLGRTIGARANTWTLEAGAGYDHVIAAGKTFAFLPQALRNGERFGASQRTQFFATESERAAAVEKYFKAAEKRATAKAKK